MFNALELKAMAAAGVVPPVVTSKMVAFNYTGYFLNLASPAYLTIVLILLLRLGLFARLRDAIEQRVCNRLAQIACFSVCLSMLLLLAMFPLDLCYFWRLHYFGLSNQDFAGWLADVVKDREVTAAVDSLSFVLAFCVIDRFPRSWSRVGWLIITPLFAAAVFLSPVVHDPLFNRIEPMPAGDLLNKIEVLLNKAGIPHAPVLIVDESRQSRAVNAYVTGIGASARVVIYDNTIAMMPQDQVLFMVAHEIGHYKMRHGLKLFLLSDVGLLVLLIVLHRAQNRLVKLLPRRWHIRGMTDIAAIPVWTLGIVVGTLMFAPVDNGVRRYVEHQADAYGLKLTGDGPAAARMFSMASKLNLEVPDPPSLIHSWFFAHPSPRHRIDFALGLPDQY